MSKLSEYYDYRLDAEGNPYLEVALRGSQLLRLPAINKGTAFSSAERIELGLDGLLPPQVRTLEQQVEGLYSNYQQQPNDIAKYLFLRAVQERSDVLFFGLLERHLEEMVPIVYTPTIGLAVQQFSALFTTPRGLTLSVDNIERADDVLENCPLQDVRMIVVTDASAILGIGDQGMGGLAICIGKLSLYTVGGGLCPFQTLPVNLDVGTDRGDLVNNATYLGIRAKRLHDDAYWTVVDKFVAAVQKKWPKAIVQWEDFSKQVAFKVLERYRQRIPCFNDDIQGTGAVALAGLILACRQKGESLIRQTVVVAGAGAGGIGVASAILQGLIRAGLPPEQASRQIFVIDGRGLVINEPTTEAYKLPLAHDKQIYRDWPVAADRIPTLLEVVANSQASVLLGLSGVAGLFSETVIKTMAGNHQRPIVFPLSNPNDKCEATPQDIFDWTGGQAIVATGSPFADVEYQGRRHQIAQGNNAFIFPGLGFAAVLAECNRISDAMVQEAAYALADYTEEHWLADGLIFPPVSDLRNVSLYVATRVLAQALEDGSASRQDLRGMDLEAYVKARVWQAKHLPVKYAPAGLSRPRGT